MTLWFKSKKGAPSPTQGLAGWEYRNEIEYGKWTFPMGTDVRSVDIGISRPDEATKDVMEEVVQRFNAFPKMMELLIRAQPMIENDALRTEINLFLTQFHER